jgi:Uma2 family endonuclease
MELARLIEPERVVKLRRAQFEEMIERGLFHENDRIQLLEGMLVQMSPQGERACTHDREAQQRAGPADRRSGRRRPQVPFRAGDYSRPEPDLAIWPLAEDGAPPPERPLLVIEVAVSSLRDDRLVMAPIYAAAGVPEY